MSRIMTKQDLQNIIYRSIIGGTKGKFFSVKFKKANGEIRDMNCRAFVKKDVKGTGYPMSKTKQLIRWRVWDLQKKGWRTIPIDRIISIKTSGLKVEEN